MDSPTPKRAIKRAAKKGTSSGKQVPSPAILGHTAASNAKKRGVAAFFGTWPGDETDHVMDALVREVRSS